MIVVEGVSKTYANGQPAALDNVSLQIADGAIFGIVGRSGAGKSTLLRCLNLLERPTSGRILLDGQDLTRLNDKQLRQQRQRIGMIFQEPATSLNPVMSIGRQIEEVLALHLGMRGDAARQRARELLAHIVL